MSLEYLFPDSFIFVTRHGILEKKNCWRQN